MERLTATQPKTYCATHSGASSRAIQHGRCVLPASELGCVAWDKAPAFYTHANVSEVQCGSIADVGDGLRDMGRNPDTKRKQCLAWAGEAAAVKTSRSGHGPSDGTANDRCETMFFMSKAWSFPGNGQVVDPAFGLTSWSISVI